MYPAFGELVLMVEIQFEWLEIRHDCGLGIKKSRKLYRARHPPPYSSREDAVLWYTSPDNLNLSLNAVDKSNFCNRDSGGYARRLSGVYVRTVLPETRSSREAVLSKPSVYMTRCRRVLTTVG